MNLRQKSELDTSGHLDKNSITGPKSACLCHLLLTLWRQSSSLVVFRARCKNCLANFRFCFKLAVLVLANAFPNLGSAFWRHYVLQPGGDFDFASLLLGGGEAFANNISATKPCRIGLTFLEVSPSLYSLLARAIAVVTDHLPGLQPLWSCVVHDVRHALMT